MVSADSSKASSLQQPQDVLVSWRASLDSCFSWALPGRECRHSEKLLWQISVDYLFYSSLKFSGSAGRLQLDILHRADNMSSVLEAHSF